MSEIGELLKELRIKKGLSIDDIQEITKIRSRYIQAIEEGNLDKLPGQFYAKAFIKTYAEVVELDPKILEEYQESLPTQEIEEIKFQTPYISMSKTSSKLGKWLFTSLIYIFIFLILMLVYIFIVSYSPETKEDIIGDPILDSRPTVPVPPEKNGENLNNEEQEDNNQVTEIPKADIKIIKTNSTTLNNRPYDTYEITAAKDAEITVKLKFTGLSWFDIKDGGQKGIQLVTGKKDKGQETEIILMGDLLWIHLGYASAVDIYINDKQVKAGNENGPKYISLTRKIE